MSKNVFDIVKEINYHKILEEAKRRLRDNAKIAVPKGQDYLSNIT
jgi:hypothetical protein